MKTNLILLLSILLPFSVMSQTLTVKQDGTGDFTTIQAAVDSAQNGDTVLVWPGIYYENVRIVQKNIVLGSLTLTTGDNNYIRQTVIDANHISRPLYIYASPGNTVINGFEIRNGYQVDSVGNAGAGIFAIDCEGTFIIKNCYIHHNETDEYGGGVMLYRNNANYLSNVTVSHNISRQWGGGISIGVSPVVFDSVNRCNIYENYAAHGTDISKGGGDTLTVYVDTFTVVNPDFYYAFSPTNNRNLPKHDLFVDVKTGKIQPVWQDLYVSIDGNDSNSGLTPREPLRTISYALLKMQSDSLSPDTIHVQSGYYCDTTNGENFPLSLKSFITVKGETRNTTILDARYKSNHFCSTPTQKNYNIEKFTLINGNGYKISNVGYASIYLRKGENIMLDSLLIKHCISYISNGGIMHNTRNSYLKNTEFIDNTGGSSFRVAGGWYETYDTMIISNIKVIRNMPDNNYLDDAFGGDLWCMCDPDLPASYANFYIYNSLFHHNEIQNSYYGMLATCTDSYHSKVSLINCTLTENKGNPASDVAAIGVSINGTMNIYNSILYNNVPYEFVMFNSSMYPGDNNLTITHSLVDGGLSKVVLIGEDNYINYDYQTNLDTDPLFYGGAEFPYNLSDESPCIDAGTLDLPQFILDNMPDVDLAGNPRIVNGKIDMGCYEWNPSVGTEEHRISNPEHRTPNLKVSPNPFSTTAYISAQWQTAAQVDMEVYNTAGLLVKTLQSGKQLPGSCKIPWHGTDNNGKYLPSGIYLVVLRVDGKEKESVKVVKE